MPSVQFWMNYTIWFRDEEEWAAAISSVGTGLLKMTPREAGTRFGIPFPLIAGDQELLDKNIAYYGGFYPGQDLSFPNASGIILTDSQLTFNVPGQSEYPASPHNAPDGVFTWSGSIVRVGPGSGVIDDPPATPIAQRRWIGGRELHTTMEGGTGGGHISLDASRVVGGHGFQIRGTSITTAWLRSIVTYRPGLQPKTSWERFYIRVRKLPLVNPQGIWRCLGFNLANCGFGIKLTTAGDLHGYNSQSLVDNDAGTIFTPDIDTWYRVDLFLRYDNVLPGKIKIHINGTLVYSFTAAGVGMGANQYHTQSEIGPWTGVFDHNCEVDFDDWICADLPGNVDPISLTFLDENYSVDWLLGSHVKLQYGLSAVHTSWTPAGAGIGPLNQALAPLTRIATSELTSATSGATITVESDALPQTELEANIFGAVAAIVSTWGTNSGNTDGQLGYMKAGAAAVLATIDQSTTQHASTVAYLPSGMIFPDEIAPWSLVHTKSVNTDVDKTFMLLSIVEYIGTWGSEDDPFYEDLVPRIGWLHNAKYFNTQYVLPSKPAIAVFAVGATYVGNGTYQEIELPDACHFLFIRGVASGATNIIYFGAGLSPHTNASDTAVPNCRMWYDELDGKFKFSVTGTTELNANGATYQYIAFCDPGMRFNLCGVYSHSTGISSPQANPLIATDFTANGGFVQVEMLDVASSLIGLWFRGPGTPSTQADPLQGIARLASGMTFGTGVLNSYTGLHSPATSTGGSVCNYSLWRTADSNGLCPNVMIQIVSYIGNGVASRVITLTPTSLRYPLFILVVPAGGATASYYRDPSHAGANSSTIGSTANAASGIIAAGIDTITVGINLNTNLIPYNVFVICGDTAGMNNGIFWPSYCAGPDVWEEPDPVDGDINIVTDGGLILGGDSPLTLLKDVSGIYTLVKDLHHDELIDRQPGQASIDTKIPDPIFKTGYLGG